VWPETLRNHLNPDVTVRSRGIMEKCSFCVHRIRRATRTARSQDRQLLDGEIQTACSSACPTSALNFGNFNDPNSKVSTMRKDQRHYTLLDQFATEPNVIYLAKVDTDRKVGSGEAASHG
jgi:molybdopterin-containing oxidoreductase family iron-sulfur binding subunit